MQKEYKVKKNRTGAITAAKYEVFCHNMKIIIYWGVQGE